MVDICLVLLLGSVGVGHYQEVEIGKRPLILLVTLGIKRQEEEEEEKEEEEDEKDNDDDHMHVFGSP